MKPVNDLVSETLERTVEAWKELPDKHLAPRDVLEGVDGQLERAAAETRWDDRSRAARYTVR